MSLSRRQCLLGLGGVAAGGALLSVVDKAGAQNPQAGPTRRFEQVGGDFGWTPHKLDPDEVASLAYDGYWHKDYACGFGCFYSLIGLMGEKFGAPYNTFPFTMLEANKGGISDWGTICGALYGAVAAFALFYGRDERNPMVHELFRWYEKAMLPVYKPEKAVGVEGDLPMNASGSVLCHISVSRWCYESKIEATARARNERCGRLTADVAKKACEILNARIDAGKEYKGVFARQEAVEYCGSCHQVRGEEPNWAKGVMDCTPCHDGRSALADKFKAHP